MKLLIVGASGFIGKNLIEELGDGRHSFSKVAATFLRDASFPAFVKPFGIAPVRYNSLNDHLSRDEYDVCIYLAGNSDHHLAIQDPSADLSMNALGLLNMLRTFHGHLVYMSSGAVYYGLTGYVDTATSVTPIFSYGISKLACEHYVKAAHHKGNIDSYVMLRLFYAYGKYDKPRRLIPRVAQALLLEGRREFSVRGNGLSFMDPLEARFVAHVLLKAALTQGTSDVFDLCGGNNRTVIEVVKEIGRALGKEITVAADGEAEAFPLLFYSKPDRIRTALGLPALPSFEEGIQNYARWHLINQGGTGIVP